MKSSLASTYRTHPVHRFPWLAIETGHDALARALLQASEHGSEPGLLVIDGFSGLPWSDFIGRLRAALAGSSAEIRWLCTDTCLRSPAELQAMLAASLTRDPVFGRLFHGEVEDFWVPEQIASLRQQIERGGDGTLT